MEIQDNFFSNLLNKEILLYMVNGIKLEGVMVDNDKYTILIESSKGNGNFLVYKHSIASVGLKPPTYVPTSAKQFRKFEK